MNRAEPVPPSSPPAADTTVPAGYREGFLTAITVFLGFSLAFLRFWAFETPGSWSLLELVSAAVLCLGIVFQLFALYRSLSLADHERPHYARTVQIFFIGVLVVMLGVLLVAPMAD